MRKGTSFNDFTVFEYASWEDIHEASKWPVKLSYNRYHKIPIFNSRISSLTVRTHTRKSGLKQYMIKKPAGGRPTHRWFAYALYGTKPSEVEIRNDVFRKW